MATCMRVLLVVHERAPWEGTAPYVAPFDKWTAVPDPPQTRFITVLIILYVSHVNPGLMRLDSL